ncbi:unnamed protein product [Polarella glacialis]|uniref:Intraflagellar transport protein 122 homolog n=1 Tax=Polarella glacialis TaxID=89957 RepID=A0A813LEE3_POLGL|nr:unnamed protein product [Polarella glacialis]
MRTVTLWQDKVPEREKYSNCIWSIAFKPDGSQIIVAAGNRVLVYDATDGDLVHSLKGHKESVFCVAYSRHGKKFASGGADKQVIIWTHKAEGILKYNHNESIQCLAYNPVTQQLASGTASDLGLWSPEQKSVSKRKVNSKILAMSWTNDGLHIALGLFSGHISIRDKFGEEKADVVRTAPIWTLAWNPVQTKTDPTDILVVGCWDQTVSFYKVSGQESGREHKLDFEPCSIDFFSSEGLRCDTPASLGGWESPALNTPKSYGSQNRLPLFAESPEGQGTRPGLASLKALAQLSSKQRPRQVGLGLRRASPVRGNPSRLSAAKVRAAEQFGLPACMVLEGSGLLPIRAQARGAEAEAVVAEEARADPAAAAPDMAAAFEVSAAEAADEGSLLVKAVEVSAAEAAVGVNEVGADLSQISAVSVRSGAKSLMSTETGLDLLAARRQPAPKRPRQQLPQMVYLGTRLSPAPAQGKAFFLYRSRSVGSLGGASLGKEGHMQEQTSSDNLAVSGLSLVEPAASVRPCSANVRPGSAFVPPRPRPACKPLPPEQWQSLRLPEEPPESSQTAAFPASADHGVSADCGLLSRTHEDSSAKSWIQLPTLSRSGSAPGSLLASDSGVDLVKAKPVRLVAPLGKSLEQVLIQRQLCASPYGGRGTPSSPSRLESMRPLATLAKQLERSAHALDAIRG